MVDRAIKEAWEDYRAEWLPDEHEHEVLTPLAAAFEAGHICGAVDGGKENYDLRAELDAERRMRDVLRSVVRTQANTIRLLRTDRNQDLLIGPALVERALRAALKDGG